MDKKSKFVFGIDLGTTYSCIAYVDENGMPTVVKNNEGDNTTPSVVEFESDTNVVVGQVAKESAVLYPDKTISLVKGLMGKQKFVPKPFHEDENFQYQGDEMTPEAVSAYILKKVTKDAGELLGTDVKDVVITCPAYFGTAECLATKHAGEIADLNVLAIIREPAAAAIHYLQSVPQEQDRTVMVYDLGGGTFDVTIMKISREGKAEIICYDGDMALGGQHWDQKIIDYLKLEFCEKTDLPEENLEDDDLQELQIQAESAKKMLSSKPATPVVLKLAGEKAKIELTRDTFDSLTKDLLEHTLEITERAAERAKSQHGCTVDEILLVGGSTRMPQVRENLEEKFNLPIKMTDPDEAVSKGAAIYALGEYEGKVEEWKEKLEKRSVDMSLAKNQDEAKKYQREATVKFNTIPGLKHTVRETVVIATTKSYGLSVIDENDEEKVQNMIIKNTKMEDGSIHVVRQFGTHEADQETAEIQVYESDIPEEYFEYKNHPEYGANATELGIASLELPKNLPSKSPLEVTFTLTQEGILEVWGKELSSGKEIHATLHATDGAIMSQAEVAAAKEKSKHITVT